MTLKSLQLSKYKFDVSVCNQNHYRLSPIKKEIGHLLPLFASQIQHAELEGVSNICATDAELLIICEESLTKHKAYLSTLSDEFDQGKTFTIPVCFAKGVDWKEIVDQSGMTKRKWINRIAKTEFQLTMYGFLPGFMYCKGLDTVPIKRRNTPRKKAAIGSFALGNTYAGFYNMESPAGWHIIGNTPVKLCDKSNHDKWLNIGDKIMIQSITVKEWSALKEKELDIHQYQL